MKYLSYLAIIGALGGSVEALRMQLGAREDCAAALVACHASNEQPIYFRYIMEQDATLKAAYTTWWNDRRSAALAQVSQDCTVELSECRADHQMLLNYI